MAESVDGLGRVRKTHCKHGHEFDGTEKWSTNWRGYQCRVCRQCGRLRMQRKRENPDFKQRGREATARWREKFPARNETMWKAAHEEKKQILLTARLGGCVKCGEKHPACLDFHHRNPAEKDGHIGVMRRFGNKRLLAEIAKCDVLCANCHRLYHFYERQTKEPA